MTSGTTKVMEAARTAEGRPEPSSEQGLERGRALGWQLHDLYRQFGKGWAANLTSSGLPLTPMQGRVLANLFRDDGMTQTELADQVAMDKAPLGRMLDRMEEEGWIERRPDPADRRVRRVYKTPKVDAAQPFLLERAAMMFAAAFRGMSDAEIENLLEGLARLQSNLEKFVSDDKPSRSD